MRLNSYNSQHMEAVGNLKTLLMQVGSYKLRKDEYITQMQNSSIEPKTPDQLANDPKIKDCDKKIHILQAKYKEVSQRATLCFQKMSNVPFLRRARATRWILTLSTSSYSMLIAFLSAQDESLLPMSTLLQTKCTLQVEKMEPRPYTPACVFLEDPEPEIPGLAICRDGVNWTMPAPDLRDSMGEKEKVHNIEMSGKEDTQAKELSQQKLQKGFRRLEALERKRDSEVLAPSAQKRARQNTNVKDTMVSPLEPSILMSTLKTLPTRNLPSRSGKKLMISPQPKGAVSAISSHWEESGFALCCAKVCPLGRRVAVGCDDSAVRIHSLLRESKRTEPSDIFYGHRNGLPVFGVEWNNDGRSLLSAGGDGTIRLWDTLADDGPFGSQAERTNTGSKGGKRKMQRADFDEDNLFVPGSNVGEAVSYTTGASIAVYKGHSPNTPIWSVAFAPCGYYFCSTGADATARLWTTDRAFPVRLFSGHTSANVNCVGWHPNANYVVTGSDDNTARLWDIQTGHTVRILSGSSAGINNVQISPNGRYCAGTDYSGFVHLWDLGSGRKISIFRQTQPSASKRERTLHSLSFSENSEALAVGGDDCCVRIWDVRSAGSEKSETRKYPIKSFMTHRTVVMDLLYTKRNLLVGVGKRITPVSSISD